MSAKNKKRIRNAFCIIDDSITKRAFVVQHESSKKWMLPGGGIDSGEQPKDAATRELQEESGFKYVNLEFCFPEGDAHFFKGTFNFDELGHVKRHKIFNTRTLGETSDFGFYDYTKNKVQTYSGINKKDQELRRGTYVPLHTHFQKMDDTRKTTDKRKPKLKRNVRRSTKLKRNVKRKVRRSTKLKRNVKRSTKIKRKEKTKSKKGFFFW